MENTNKDIVRDSFSDQLAGGSPADLAAVNDMLELQIAALVRDNDALLSELEDLKSERDDLVRDLQNEYDNLVSESARLEEELAAEVKRLSVECNKLAEMIRILNARTFGAKSEKIHPFQISLFNDMEAAFSPDAIEPEAAQVVEHTSRKKKAAIDWSKYTTLVIDHKLAPVERVCPACKDELEEMGYQVKRVLKIIPSHMVVEEHRQYTYVCRTCSKANEADGGETPVQIVRADMPAVTPIEGSCAHASLVAHIMYGKYGLGLPLYRIAEDLKNTAGLTIVRQTMAGWVIKAYERWLSLIYSLMRDRLREFSIIQCDETRTQVLKEPRRKPTSQSYAWLFCSAACDIPIYVFQYAQTRARSVVAEFLKDWSGTIVTDGYAAYDNLGDDISRVACLVHIKRKFSDIVKGIDKEVLDKHPDLISMQAINKIDEMFHIDNSFNDMTAEERRTERIEKLKPKMDEFYAWCQARLDEAIPSMALHGALQYATGQWPYLENALTDGRLPIENNRSERGIKAYVIGRKAWLFSDTPRGADASCGIYSIVVTARANGIEPFRYLEWLLTEMPLTEHIDDRAVLERFMPWSDSVPAACKMTALETSKPNPMTEPIIDVDPHLLDED